MKLKEFFSSGIKLSEVLNVSEMYKIRGGVDPPGFDPGCGCTQMCKKKACKSKATN